MVLLFLVLRLSVAPSLVIDLHRLANHRSQYRILVSRNYFLVGVVAFVHDMLGVLWVLNLDEMSLYYGHRALDDDVRNVRYLSFHRSDSNPHGHSRIVDDVCDDDGGDDVSVLHL